MSTACAFCGCPIAHTLVFGRVSLGRTKRLHDACRSKAQLAGKGQRRDDFKPAQIDALFRIAKARAQYLRRVAS